MLKAADEIGEDRNSNVTVSCDGSWQPRGFSSKNGVATVLTVAGCGKSSNVIDTETLSNHCASCTIMRKKLSDQDFKTWETTHECEKTQWFSQCYGAYRHDINFQTVKENPEGCLFRISW